jgi:hypothetical protein
MNQTSLKQPTAHEIEVSIFGPGFGESIVIHAGNGEWVIVDSCINSRSGKPAALTYFGEIQVEPSTAVKLIVATHWHDDHIRGMSELNRVCTSAKFACSMALTRREFLEVAKVYTSRPLSEVSSGPTEIFRTLSTLKSRRQFPVHTIADRPLFRMRRGSTGSIDWEVTALSPGDAELDRFLASIVALIPSSPTATTKSRLPNPDQNELSVATWITLGDIHILLGADLEEYGIPGRGWTAVLASSTRPQGVASLFKISHHGSANGHHSGVWSSMLVKSPMAVLTPWTLGASELPQPRDIQRIKNLTPNAYCTSKLKAPGLTALPQAAKRIFREAGIKIRQTEPPTGFLRLRTPASSTGGTVWTLTASTDAVRLS